MSATTLWLSVAIVLLAAVGMASSSAALADVADRRTVNLVTIGRKSGQPRTVTIWFLVEGGRAFVQAGRDGKTDWFRNLKANPEVRLEFDDARFTGRAEVVADPAISARVIEGFRQKYWLARLSGWVGLGIGHGRVVSIEIEAGE